MVAITIEPFVTGIANDLFTGLERYKSNIPRG